jgi:hypothetical protein
MKKMMLLASMVAIATLMMAAAPALAQSEGDRSGGKITICHRTGSETNPYVTITVDRNGLNGHGGHEGDIIPAPEGGCPGEEPPPQPPEDNNNDRDNNNRDNNNRDNNNRNNNVVPVFEISQDLDQEAESGDVDQSFDVSQTGDNSNQTVSIQGVANTGNTQNQIGVIDANGFGNFDGNNDDNDRFFFDDDQNNDDHGFFVFDDDNDRFFGNNGSDFEFDDVGSTIEVSPTNTTSSDQQVNQAASAFGS